MSASEDISETPSAGGEKFSAYAYVERCSWDPRLGRTHKGVLLALSAHAFTGPDVFPSVPTIARLTGFSESTVREALRDLERWGFAPPESRHNAKGGRTSNRYRLTIPADAPNPPPPPATGGPPHRVPLGPPPATGGPPHRPPAPKANLEGEEEGGERTPPPPGLPLATPGHEVGKPSAPALARVEPPAVGPGFALTAAPGKRRKGKSAVMVADADPTALLPSERAVYEAITEDPSLVRLCSFPAQAARDVVKNGNGLDLVALVNAAGAFLRTDDGQSRGYSDGARFLQNQITGARRRGQHLLAAPTLGATGASTPAGFRSRLALPPPSLLPNLDAASGVSR